LEQKISEVSSVQPVHWENRKRRCW